MKKLILLLITLTTFVNASYASFPISIGSVNEKLDPTTDSWIPIIIAFWSIVILLVVLIIKLFRRGIKKE